MPRAKVAAFELNFDFKFRIFVILLLIFLKRLLVVPKDLDS